MRKTLLGLIASGLFAANAGAAFYTDFEDYITWSSPLGFQVKQGVSLTGTFNLLDYGYNPQIEQVTTSYVSFLLWDPKGGTENVYISLGGSSSVIWSGSVSLALTWDAVQGSSLTDLSSDGILAFSVNAIFGEAYVKSATLVATSRVPDGGATLTLLGLGFLGILGAQRRFALAR